MTALAMTARCPDCQAAIGQPHLDGCDTARCLWDGTQRLICPWFGQDPIRTEHDCGKDTWTGHWPGDVEAAEFGWWIYWGPPWIRCSPDHLDARPDLNRLHLEAVWDRRAKRWVKP